MKIINDYKENDVLEFKKPHPCGGTTWKVIKFGVDCKLECTTCCHAIILSRIDISKRIKRIIKDEEK